MAVLAESDDQEEIIARVAALDIGKADLVCCVRLPPPGAGSVNTSPIKRPVRWSGGVASRPEARRLHRRTRSGGNQHGGDSDEVSELRRPNQMTTTAPPIAVPKTLAQLHLFDIE